eukprot:CAMPEP_0116901324 /NCGR_PEP_ID=MMETSP0467-20121206/9277_1 /TAXON_ID=283647 /ORGANISM="Mesodinium pulex, Strain SPMC105" /LENGTH=259 /DNA_ID=CAMNT_0004574799 /DNA_START=181 /DNA_END=957 /DNA_ORIENTATION=-
MCDPDDLDILYNLDKSANIKLSFTEEGCRLRLEQQTVDREHDLSDSKPKCNLGQGVSMVSLTPIEEDLCGAHLQSSLHDKYASNSLLHTNSHKKFLENISGSGNIKSPMSQAITRPQSSKHEEVNNSSFILKHRSCSSKKEIFKTQSSQSILCKPPLKANAINPSPILSNSFLMDDSTKYSIKGTELGSSKSHLKKFNFQDGLCKKKQKFSQKSLLSSESITEFPSNLKNLKNQKSNSFSLIKVPSTSTPIVGKQHNKN